MLHRKSGRQRRTGAMQRDDGVDVAAGDDNRAKVCGSSCSSACAQMQTCPTHYDVRQGGLRAACRARRQPSLRVGPQPRPANGRCACGVPSTQQQRPKARRDGTVCVPRLSGSASCVGSAMHVRNPRTSLRSKAHSMSTHARTHAGVKYARACSRRRAVARGTRSRARGLAR